MNDHFSIFNSTSYYDTNVPPGFPGLVRISNGVPQVYDSSGGWIPIAEPTSNLAISAEMTDALCWLLEEHQKYKEVQKQAEEHPAVAIALENFNKAKKELYVTSTLAKEQNG